MLNKVILLHLILTLHLISCVTVNDKAIFDPEDPEARIHKKRKGNRRPCRGRSAPEGRTFFDWSLAYVDVNYNYNYNINCGGGGGGGNHQNDGGGGAPNKPIINSILQNVGNRPQGGGSNNGPFSFVQSQFQGILSNGQGLGGIFNGEGLGSLVPQGGIFNGEGLGSWLPQGGLFNGQGISSLFENGLIRGIFDGPQRPPTSPSSQNTRPPSPPPRPPSLPPTTRPPATTYRPSTTQDPDDIIYNDEKPVHEDHDDVFPDSLNRPAPYNYNSYNYNYNRPRPYQYRSQNRIRFSN